MKCCPSPEFDGVMCQNCFEKPKKYLVPVEGIKSYHAIQYQMRHEGEWLPLTLAGRLEFITMWNELNTTGLERPVNRVRYAIWSALCALIIVVVAYFVASLMGKQ